MLSLKRSVLLAVLMACSSPSAPVVDAGTEPGLAMRVPLDGQPCVEAHLDGRPSAALLVVDTGAIRTAVDKSLLRNVANGVGVVTIDLGDGIVLTDYEVLAADLSSAKDHIGVPLAGLIGQDLVNRYAFGVDYRAGRAYVTDADKSPIPRDLKTTPIALPYEVVQGLPIVTVRIGDAAVRMLADTGSGVTLITRSKAPKDALGKGLEGYVWYTSYGSDPATIIRIPSIDVAGREVQQSWAIVIPDEHHLKSVFSSLKIDIDGFLGYPVYREFFVAVRGQQKRFDLLPYASPDPRGSTEWNRAGFEVHRSGDAVVIDMVFSPSDASSKGVARDDIVNKIDDVHVSALELDDIRQRLRGTVGTTRRMSLSRGGVEQQVDVRVDALLP